MRLMGPQDAERGEGDVVGRRDLTVYRYLIGSRLSLSISDHEEFMRD